MPEFLEDPSVLTKDKLKSELLAHNVELPSGNPNKDVFVLLYLNNLTVRNKNQPKLTVDGFSSDEELPPPVVSGRSRSSGKKSSRNSEKIEMKEPDVTALTDEGLRDELLKHGVVVGPIVASTRKLYEKKLQKLLDGPAQLPQVNHNGNHESTVYSDEDEVISEPEPETEAEPEPAPPPVLERAVRSRGKNSSIIIQQQEVEKISARDQSSKGGEKDVLKELFPNEANGPTGLSVTSRRAIRGASRLPVTPNDLGFDENHLLSPKTTKTSSSSHTEIHTVHRVSSTPSSFSSSSSSSSSSILPLSGSCPPSKLCSAAPPTGQSKVVRSSSSPWMKLALLGCVALFLFLVYQTMEPGSSGALGK
uniref:Thymopoietin a n=1 Tax=Austrofundulus limnaeus TaxID=52670 RepID=A0A2I4CGM4_AUSLI